MQTANRFAFKEWAAVCAALAAGEQTIILRKGGIHEGRDGFRVEHGEFWLFPTRFHQSADELAPQAERFLTEAARDAPPNGLIRLDLYAVVTDVLHVDDATRLAHLAGRHVLSARTLQERFDYRTPGLFALVARLFRRDEPLLIPDSPHFAGCRSWVDLPTDLATDGLRPVLDDATFERERAAIVGALATEVA